MFLRLAAICPCVLIAGIVTAAGVPKSWQQRLVPIAAAVPAIHPSARAVLTHRCRALAPHSAARAADAPVVGAAVNKPSTVVTPAVDRPPDGKKGPSSTGDTP